MYARFQSYKPQPNSITFTKGRAMLPQKAYLKSTEVAEIFDVNPSTISLWVKKGKLRPHKTLGGNFRFRRSDIEKIISEKDTSLDQPAVTERRKEPRYTVSYPVIVKTGVGAISFTYNAIIRDISGHGMNLLVLDSNDLLGRLTRGEAAKLTVLNLPEGLFKEEVVGQVRHFEQSEERQVILGVSIEK
jgi:excisionase family DNA binding protein